MRLIFHFPFSNLILLTLNSRRRLLNAWRRRRIALNRRRDYHRNADNYRSDNYCKRDILIVFNFLFDRKRRNFNDNKKCNGKNNQADQNENYRRQNNRQKLFEPHDKS